MEVLIFGVLVALLVFAAVISFGIERATVLLEQIERNTRGDNR